MSLGDIYYILFRRKWVILGFTLLGLIAAGVTYVVWNPGYQSVAELYIGYVADAQAPDITGSEIHNQPIDRGALILNSEIKILLSFDVAKQVADTIGPAKILGGTAAGTNAGAVDMAAGVIRQNLQADVSRMTQIITVSFTHPNADIVRPVLEQLITNYIVKHADIHQRTGQFDTILRDKAEESKSLLTETERQLAQLKNQGGIVDLGEALKSYAALEMAIQQENNTALAELDAALARANVLSNYLRQMNQANRGPGASTNAGVAKLSPPTAAEVDAYNKARQHLAELQTFEATLESKFTTNNSQVKTNLLEIEAAQARKKALEEATPGLVVVAAAAESKTPAAPAGFDPMAAYEAEATLIAGLKAKVARQASELAGLKEQGTSLVTMEAKIHDLEKSRQIYEDEHLRMERTSDNLTIAAEYGPNRVSNISVSEWPTPPGRDLKLMTKVLAGITGGGVVLGLGLAFLLEMVLDRSFKRPQEVVSKLGLPFFLSVPYLNGRGPLRLSKGNKAVKLLPASAEAGGAGVAAGKELARAPEGPMASWDEKHALRPFHETLRDRLIAYFEMVNLTHKPKLVALTSCHNGSGVSTMASGLASVLSETGDGNVLLVDMNSEDGAAHRFYKGKLNLGLDDLFEKEKGDRQNALVQDNLYVVKESSNQDKLPAMLPKRFSHLVSKMKASDYDYIIFDMPPVTQISVTPRLARFMDMVLLVVESEKTDREVAQRAAALLSESRGNVGVVMNKNRSYVPKRLHQEL